LSTVKFIFTICSVVELSSTGATFAFVNHLAIDASLACHHSIHFSLCAFQNFSNGGQICFSHLRGNYASSTNNVLGNVYVSP